MDRGLLRFAIAVGFLLVTIFYRGGSLLPCIIVHSAINTLGTFANDANLTTEIQVRVCRHGSKVTALCPDAGANAASCAYERNGRKIWRSTE